jgi:hypothetical protein
LVHAKTAKYAPRPARPATTDDARGLDSRTTARLKNHASRRKEQQKRIAAAKSGKNPDAPKTTSSRPAPKEIPGATKRMIIFILICNGFALVLLSVWFPVDHYGIRHWPSGDPMPRFSIPWPELLTLLAGHLVAFALWAHFIFQQQKRMNSEAAELATAKAAGANGKRNGDKPPTGKKDSAKKEGAPKKTSDDEKDRGKRHGDEKVAPDDDDEDLDDDEDDGESDDDDDDDEEEDEDDDADDRQPARTTRKLDETEKRKREE